MARWAETTPLQIERAVIYLSFELVSGRCISGTSVDLAGVAQQLGVSRAAVRRALVQFQDIGLVEHVLRRGMVYSPNGLSGLKQTLEEIEVMVVKDLARLAVRLAAADDGFIWPHLHQAHKNPALRQISARLWQPFFHAHAHALALRGELAGPPVLAGHADVRSSEALLRLAIADGDVILAEQAARTHVRLLLAALQPQ